MQTDLTITAVGRAEWFDAWTGRFSAARVTRADARGMTVPLRLARRESVVLCVEKGPPPSAAPSTAAVEGSASSASPDPATKTLPLETGWTLLDPQGQTVGRRLGDWLLEPSTGKFAGTIRYETTFTLTPAQDARYTLDLGRVGDFAVVTLNGRDLGVRFWAPFAWDITPALRDGANELVVAVTNSLANRYDAKVRIPSGLFGPVNIEEHAHPPGE